MNRIRGPLLAMLLAIACMISPSLQRSQAAHKWPSFRVLTPTTFVQLNNPLSPNSPKMPYL